MPALAEGDLFGLRCPEAEGLRERSPLDDLDVPGSPGAGDRSPELDMGTSGGMSFGAGARNVPDFPESLPAGELPSLLSDLLSSFLGELDLLRSLLESLDSLSLLSLEDLSMGGMMDLEGVVSFPILLHVCANSARGLFLASS